MGAPAKLILHSKKDTPFTEQHAQDLSQTLRGLPCTVGLMDGNLIVWGPPAVLERIGNLLCYGSTETPKTDKAGA